MRKLGPLLRTEDTKNEFLAQMRIRHLNISTLSFHTFCFRKVVKAFSMKMKYNVHELGLKI